MDKIMFKILCFLSIVVIQQLSTQDLPLTDNEHSNITMLRSKRGLLDYVSLNEFNWLHKFLEMIFGDLYTDLIDNKNVIMTTPSSKLPFEAHFKPWFKNITSFNKAYTRQQPHLSHVNLPYPHIFTTPRSRRPTTTLAPSTSPTYNIMVPTTTSLFEKLAAPFTTKFEKIPDIPQDFMHAKPNLNHQKSSEELSKTCDNCQPDKQCILRLKSFETTDPAFQYAYSHGTALSDLLDSVMRETQTTNIPPPWTWKSTATPEVVQLTTSLMNLYKPNRSLVVGVFTGLALLGVATVTDSRGIVIGLEYPEYVHLWEKVGMKHAQRAGIMSRIQVRSLENVDKALTKLAAYEPNAFDFVFINELRKINLLDDYEHAVRLLRTNGLLIITDAFENGAVISGPEFSHSEGRQIVQAMNSRIKTDPRVNASLLPYGGGTWIIVKN